MRKVRVEELLAGCALETRGYSRHEEWRCNYVVCFEFQISSPCVYRCLSASEVKHVPGYEYPIDRGWTLPARLMDVLQDMKMNESWKNTGSFSLTNLALLGKKIHDGAQSPRTQEQVRNEEEHTRKWFWSLRRPTSSGIDREPTPPWSTAMLRSNSGFVLLLLTLLRSVISTTSWWCKMLDELSSHFTQSGPLQKQQRQDTMRMCDT